MLLAQLSHFPVSWCGQVSIGTSCITVILLLSTHRSLSVWAVCEYYQGLFSLKVLFLYHLLTLGFPSNSFSHWLLSSVLCRVFSIRHILLPLASCFPLCFRATSTQSCWSWRTSSRERCPCIAEVIFFFQTICLFCDFRLPTPSWRNISGI